jgi:hypothetical protein
LEEDVAVAEMLQRNPKIRLENVPDPENPSLMVVTYAYQAKYSNVRDKKTLLAQVNRCKNGVPMRDLVDAYDGVKEDLESLICAGDVLASLNTEDKDKTLFPRGEPFFVELDGIISLPPIPEVKEESTPLMNVGATMNGGNGIKTENGDNGAAVPSIGTENGDDPRGEEEKKSETIPSSQQPNKPPIITTVDTDSDPLSQIHRGEAINIGGTWFRVSTAVTEGSLKDQPARARAPLSAVMMKELDNARRNEQDGYIRPFNEQTIPIDAELPLSAIRNLQKAKEARERLLKAAHGRAGGAASQLLGSNAHAANPVSLAASFGSNSAAARRRPNKTSGGGNPHRHHADLSQAKEAALDPYLSLYSHARRHGCTKDVRALYLKTSKMIPSNDAELQKMLVENKLLEPGEEMRRAKLQKRSNVDNDGKPKKRRYYERKNQRMTNTHLEGTEIGAMLHQAAERQREGKQVGDGGM